MRAYTQTGALHAPRTCSSRIQLVANVGRAACNSVGASLSSRRRHAVAEQLNRSHHRLRVVLRMMHRNGDRIDELLGVFNLQSLRLAAASFRGPRSSCVPVLR